MVTIVLHREYVKGHIAFAVPSDEMSREAIRRELTKCRDKHNDYVLVTIASPKRPRTTGDGSQNHMLNGNIMQICNETGNDYDTVKLAVKMIAVEQLGYPYKTIAGNVIPLRERESSTIECSKLIEASFMLAADLGIILREE